MTNDTNHTDVLDSFVDLFANNPAYTGDTENQSSFERDEIVDEPGKENPGRAMKSDLTELFELVKARSSIHLDAKQAACIEAVVDSVYENRGLFAFSYEHVAAEYMPIFGELKTAELNRARVFLMHQGPVLGLGARNTEEFKWVISRHFAVGKFTRDHALQNRQLLACYNHLAKGGKAIVAMFVELCRVIYEAGKAPRRLTPSKVVRLLKCSEAEAALLGEVYEALPKAPLA